MKLTTFQDRETSLYKHLVMKCFVFGELRQSQREVEVTTNLKAGIECACAW